MIDVLPEIRPLLAEDRLNELGPGTPNLAVKPQLLDLSSKLATITKDHDFAAACLAGLWLLHDFVDESHAISQDLDTLEGSFWHGILHRREPDYWNAKYWFRRVPRHPIFAALGTQAAALTDAAEVPTGSKFLINQTRWDAAAFVDLCEAAAAEAPAALNELCRRIQRCEWDLLFRYCHERAFL